MAAVHVRAGELTSPDRTPAPTNAGLVPARGRYSGVTRTLIEGFEAAEGVEVRFGAGTRRNASRAFHRNITQWLRERDLFVWIGVNHGEAPWEQLARRGIRRVVYQTEPTHSCEGAHRNRMDELWDFSWCGLLVGPSRHLCAS